MSELKADCKFEIGDMVTLASMIACCKPENYQPMQVVERHIQQCYGGIQVLYKVHPIKHTGMFNPFVEIGDHYHTLVEPELAAFPMDATEKALDAARVAAKAAFKAAAKAAMEEPPKE